MRHLTLLLACAAALAAQSYRAEILAGPGEVREGPALETQLRYPLRLAEAPDGSLAFSDVYERRIFRLTPAGRLEIIAGNGEPRNAGDGGPARLASLEFPRALAFDRAGNLFFVDGNYVRRVDADTGVVTRVAGNGASDLTPDGPALRSPIQPADLAFDNRGGILIADRRRIRRLDLATGDLTTIAGSVAGPGCNDCPALEGNVSASAVRLDRSGNLWILASTSRALHRIDTGTGVIRIVYQTGSVEADGVSANDAAWQAFGFEFDADDNILLYDSGRVRRIDKATGIIRTIAGSADFGSEGDGGPPSAARFDGLAGLIVRANGEIVVTDAGSGRIRLISRDRVRTTAGRLKAGRPPREVALGLIGGVAAAPDGSAVLSGAPLLRVRQNETTAVRDPPSWLPSTSLRGAGIDREGTLYAFQSSYWLRIPATGPVLPVGSVPGASSTFGIDSAGFLISVQPALARLTRVNPITGNGLVRMVPASIVAVDSRDQIYTLEAGRFFRRESFNGAAIAIPAVPGRLGQLDSLAVDSKGTLFMVDQSNGLLRRLDPSGTVTTLWDFAGFSPGSAVAVDSQDNLLLSDPRRSVVYRLEPVVPDRLQPFGNAGQTRRAGSATVVSFLVSNPDGTPAVGVPVDFALAGGGTLSATRSSTGNDGLASVSVNLPNPAGPVTVRATTGALPGVDLRVNAVADPPAGEPRINAGGIVSAGLFNRVTSLSPGGIATIFGTNLAESGPLRRVSDRDLIAGRVPTAFAGVCVRVGTTFAPVFAVSEGQINFQVPYVTAGGPTPVRVIRRCLTAEARESEPEFVGVYREPEYFHFHDRFVAAIDAVSGAFLGPPGLLPGATFTPARPGQLVTLFGTGFGPTTPAVAAGEIPQVPTALVWRIGLNLGSVMVPPGDITYAGLAPFNPGLYQINFRVPDNLTPGEYRINGSESVLMVGN